MRICLLWYVNMNQPEQSEKPEKQSKAPTRGTVILIAAAILAVAVLAGRHLIFPAGQDPEGPAIAAIGGPSA